MADEETPSFGERLPRMDADVRFFGAFFSRKESDDLLLTLTETIDWRQESMSLFGKTVAFPRLTAWYGDPGVSYSYSGRNYVTQPWAETLTAIRLRIEPVAQTRFNSVLLNLYRDERDSMGWHSDDEPELGTDPIIASVNLGATRTFQFRHREDPTVRAEVALTHGSLLLMAGATQHHWQHRIPKTTKPLGPRINLTFRATGMHP